VYVSYEKTKEFLPGYVRSTEIHRRDKNVLKEILTTIKHTCMLTEHANHYDVKHGPYKKFNQLGVLQMEGSYWHGAKIGTWKTYGEDGALLKATFHEKPEVAPGTISIFYEDGTLFQQGIAVNHKSEGEWKFFDKQGRHERSEFYKNGIETGERKIFYPRTGQLWQSYHRKRYKELENRLTEYYRNGNVKIKIDYTNGIYDGLYEKYSEDGTLELTYHYSMGKLNGLSTEYDKSGLILKQGNYELGNKVGPWKSYSQKLNCYSIFDFGNGQYSEEERKKRFLDPANRHYEDLDGKLLNKEELFLIIVSYAH